VTSLTLADQDLRGVLTRMIAARGYAPTNAQLAEAAGMSVLDVEASLRRLHEANALLLHPHKPQPWVVHPFALSAGGCWVECADRGYWANCLYCGFGIAAALGADATLTARLGGEGATATWRVAGGRLVDAEGIFHLSVPVARWWDNVIFACASFQPFASDPISALGARATACRGAP